ncbi:NAD(P)/FAD-dependent oxidoreductase [Sphingosinicella terrae]|uniref:NAD(P)/FAD-dependent oxidoreductase n=1 Tax=Sphingosinicella terrae TaxID=2172047 RepID=UPI003D7C8A08
MPLPLPPRPVWPVGGRSFPALEGMAKADVVVVGAGFAGVAAALELAARGRSVIVLEAEGLAAGASAASAGQVGPLLYGARKTAGQAMARLGLDRGERLNRAVAASGRRLFELIAAHGIDCEARRGFLCVYRSDKSFARAAGRFAEWQRYGGRSETIGRGELGQWIASARYRGGVFLPEGGFLNPARLISGLADAAVGAGIRLHCHSRVAAVRRLGQQWGVQTAAGQAVAPHLLVATGSGGFPAWPELARTFYPVGCGVAATAPLADRAQSLLPRSGPVADMDDPAVFSPAVTADGRLLVSFLLEGRARDDPMRNSAPARRRLERVFPDRPPPPFESLSAGRLAVTPDGLPRLIRGPEGMLAVTGCNGFGLTLGMLAAREAASFILGTPAGDLALPISEAKPLPAAGLMPALFRSVLAPLANRFGI